jgi:hypothetical protein
MNITLFQIKLTLITIAIHTHKWHNTQTAIEKKLQKHLTIGAANVDARTGRFISGMGWWRIIYRVF